MGTGREPRFIGACYLFVPEARLVIAPPPHSLYPFGLVTLSKKHLHWRTFTLGPDRRPSVHFT